MQTAVQKLSVTEKVGYSLGDLAANLIFQTLMTFLAFFYTDVYQIPAAAAATIIFIGGLIGACFNPIMGIIADRTQSRWGKLQALDPLDLSAFWRHCLVGFQHTGFQPGRQNCLRFYYLCSAGAGVFGQQPAVFGFKWY